MAKTTKAGGAKLNRTQTVTIRLDPKTRYLADLAARTQRRTTSSFIEFAIEECFKHIHLEPNDHDGLSLSDEAMGLWDVDEADRFAQLALAHPHLLTHEEQVLWKLIKENGQLWRGAYKANSEWSWSVKRESLVTKRLREHWDTFVAVAAGELDTSALPEWQEFKPSADKADDFENDIPF